jgi:transcriptional regulator with XRE-family HTH domain
MATDPAIDHPSMEHAHTIDGWSMPVAVGGGRARASERAAAPAVARPAAFGAALRALRGQAGLSLNALARRAEVDPAYVHRIEGSSRDRPIIPRRPIVLSLGRALGLNRDQLDDLLARAGYAPQALIELGGWDDSLAGVARVLADPALSVTTKAEFREVLRILAARWSGGA